MTFTLHDYLTRSATLDPALSGHLERDGRPLAPPPSGQALHLAAGDRFDTDGIAGAFPLGLWHRLAGALPLALAVETTGSARLRVVERRAGGLRILVEAELAAGTTMLDLPGVEGDEAGAIPVRRLSVEVKAREACRFTTLALCTATAPRRSLRLWLPAAETGLRAALDAALAPGDPVTLATGSFAEAAAAPALADTADIALALQPGLVADPVTLLRALRLQAHATTLPLLTAALVDPDRPLILAEAGRRLSSLAGGYQACGAGLALDRAKGVDALARLAMPDDLPWRLALVPVQGLAQALHRDGVPDAGLRALAPRATAALKAQGVVAHLCPSLIALGPAEAVFAPDGTLPLADLPPASPARAGSREMTGPLHLVQPLLPPPADRPSPLYLRLSPPRRTDALALGPGDAGLALEPEDVLSTDTFFGCFFRGYWLAQTRVDRIAIALDLSGEATIRIFEDSGAGVVQLMETTLDAPRGRRVLLEPVCLPDPGQHGPRSSRIYVEVWAVTAVVVRAIDIVSDTAPERRATLSIGLCTFNQEAYFATTLDRLTRLADRLPTIRRIHVVNQGKPFASPAILKHLENPKVSLVDQRNLGGCGGFTRSLVEELAEAEPASHHLMMDDDIVLDERMIERALRFLDYAKADIALGAGMLDSLRPSVMYEAGAFLRSNNTIEAYCHNVDLADPGQLWRFNAPVPTDYNAWWFCILPVERARALALPAPIFIRGDDFEYGQRMARAGIPTITLPGIGVWHEPFYAKPSGWQDYYDLRNRLIFAACYADRVQQLSLAHVAGLITTALLVHNYPSARLRLKAVADYLKGPKRLFAEDTEALHAAVMALGKADAPERLGADWKTMPLASPGKPKPVSMRKLALEQAGALIRNALLPHRGGEEVLMDAEARPPRVAGRRYVMTNGLRSFHLRFVPRRGVVWALTGQTFRLMLRYRSRRAEVAREWADSIASYRDPSWWQAHWDKPEAPTRRG